MNALTFPKNPASAARNKARQKRLTAIMATNGDPVEFGQPLFVIE